MSQDQDHREPTVQAKPSAPEGRLLRLYERAESALISVVALFLIVFVVIALLAVIGEVKGPLLARPPDFTAAALKGIDAAFLAIILLELLHTTLSRGPISEQLQEFLVIGITAAVRHGLELAASGRGSNPRDVVINLTINAVGALVLIAGLWLVRQQLRADRRERRAEEQGPGGRGIAVTPGWSRDESQRELECGPVCSSAHTATGGPGRTRSGNGPAGNDRAWRCADNGMPPPGARTRRSTATHAADGLHLMAWRER